MSDDEQLQISGRILKVIAIFNVCSQVCQAYEKGILGRDETLKTLKTLLKTEDVQWILETEDIPGIADSH